MDRNRAFKLSVIIAIAAVIVVGFYLKSEATKDRNLADLPDGVLALVNGQQVTEKEVQSALENYRGNQRAALENDREGLLNEVIRIRLLVAEATARKLDENADIAGQIRSDPTRKEEILLEALKAEVVKEPPDVPEEEIKKFYEDYMWEQKSKEGGSYDQMHDTIAEYLKAVKTADEFTKYGDDLVSKAAVRKKRQWILALRAKGEDPVEKAGGARRPVIADFGAGICLPCKKMIPVLEQLKKELKGRAEVVLVDTIERSHLARKYRIFTIPTQIFFDSSGNEVYRHIGFYPKEEILAKLKEVESGKLSLERGFLSKAESALREGSWFAALLVFLLGLLTASNPCVIATIPLLIGFIGGYKEASGLKKSFFFSLFFVLGLAITFMLLGIIAALTGRVIGAVAPFWTYLVAGVCIVIGLHLLSVLEFNIPVPQSIRPKHRGIIGAFLFGLLFGIISTPCAVPIIAVLMVIIAAKGSIIYGAAMLLAYSLGHSVLILIAGTSMGAAKALIESKGLTKATGILRTIAALLIIGVGFWFLFR
jgi:cytochrome c biogenesis protein CcdA/thiol-disulfide isomerase/thioredoxin